MSLDVAVRHTLGRFTLDVAFTAGSGITALFGRSGSGKTTLVNTIAGLIAPDSGRITIDGAVLVDTSQRVALPAHRRRIGYVFQDARLFPHLTVRQNLLFGQWFTPRAHRFARLDEVVALLGVDALLGRRPNALSGGEKQRVAIGRALLRSPRLLLMDEPLASLDEERKAEILPYIERLRSRNGLPIVYVSHSVAEVMRLASTVVSLDNGGVQASGPAVDVFNALSGSRGEASSPAVMFDSRVVAHDPQTGLTHVETPAGRLLMPHVDAPPGSAIRIRIDARDVMIASRKPDHLSAINVLIGSVRTLDFRDATVDVVVACRHASIVARLTRSSVERLGLATGATVYAVIKGVVIEQAGHDARNAGAAQAPHC